MESTIKMKGVDHIIKDRLIDMFIDIYIDSLTLHMNQLIDAHQVASIDSFIKTKINNEKS